MSRNLSVTEPHPSVPKGGYIGGGRGGAGNYARYKASDITPGPDATGPPSRISLSRFSKRAEPTPTGRGGAGNMYKPSDNTEAERVFKFDEELVARREQQTAPVYHIGRGGAGNSVDETVEGLQRGAGWRKGRVGSTTSSEGSVSSGDSERSGVRRSVEGAFGRLSKKWSQDR